MQYCRVLKISDGFPRHRGVFYLAPGGRANVAVFIYYKNLIGKVNLPFMHVVEHLLCIFTPNLVIAGMPEKPDAYNNISFKGQPFLLLHEFIPETGAAAKRYNPVTSYHNK